ncbi:hypothetical protein M378DRAFT_93217 [Amanita muscaria Koide BX008]|uniref:Ubiquitin-like protease family profile domain-containing protein n=1 Tax=Amanita muscaria (strain Koide BX008) TaxID=946122 RepID=A0A0C2VZ05_AMAMK|nr:hypothetical protein M378DRAFT_93217 [Amanita muscaria Koide BX008]
MSRIIDALPKQVDGHGVHKIIVKNQTVQFTENDVALLRNAASWLNDICINSCALLLQALLTLTDDSQASTCAILNSFDLPRIARGAPPDEIWRNTFRTEYWNKSTWILPIHRLADSHWVLAIIKTRERQLLLFDSFGCKEEEWVTNTKHIFLLVQKLSEIATKKGYKCSVQGSSWTVHPISKVALQRDSSSCGLWVLAVIAATLRGYHAPSFRHDHAIEEFRPLLARLLDIVYPNVSL